MCRSIVLSFVRVLEKFWLKVFRRFVERKMHFAAIFTHLESKWKLHDVKNFRS